MDGDIVFKAIFYLWKILKYPVYSGYAYVKDSILKAEKMSSSLLLVCVYLIGGWILEYDILWTHFSFFNVLVIAFVTTVIKLSILSMKHNLLH